jgi:hypothetical protein
MNDQVIKIAKALARNPEFVKGRSMNAVAKTVAEVAHRIWFELETFDIEILLKEQEKQKIKNIKDYETKKNL